MAKDDGKKRKLSKSDLKGIRAIYRKGKSLPRASIKVETSSNMFLQPMVRDKKRFFKEDFDEDEKNLFFYG